MSGLTFIPVLIGLFAMPEIINFFISGQRKQNKSALAGVGASWKDFKNCLPTIFRGSFIGVVLGAIPGIGGAPAAFMSYSEARRTSKTPDKFGTGEIKGVAAAESGNNGTAGATMIPLLALGIPGDITTAIILGAFMIHGLRPGPLMFQDNISLIYAIFMGIMLSSAYLLIVGKLSIRAISRIADIPHRVLFPVVLVLCVFGSYAVNNTIYDVGVMFVMGMLGFVMLKLSIPIFFSSAICWFFWFLTMLSVIYLTWQHLRNSKKSHE